MKAKSTKGANHVVTPRAKNTKPSTAAPTTSALTPPKGAVATPGESAKKEKKKAPTLKSFFTVGKKDVATKPLAGNVGKSEGEKKAEGKKLAPKKAAGKGEKTKPSVLKSAETKQAAVMTKKTVVVIDKAEELEAKQSENVDPNEDDDKTVDLEADQIPDTSYDSSSDQSVASVDPMEEIVVGDVGDESPSPLKSSDEESKDAVVVEQETKPSKSTGNAFSMFVARPAKQSETTTVDLKELSVSADSKANESTSPTETMVIVESEVKPSETPKPTEDLSKQKAVKQPESTSVGSTAKVKKCTSKPKAPSKATPTEAAEPAPLSEENLARMKQYTTLREHYVIRAVEVASRCTSDDFVEETLCDEELALLEKGSVEVGEDGGFPDELLPRLLILVQGR